MRYLTEKTREKKKSTLWKSICNSLALLMGFSRLYLLISILYKSVQGVMPMLFIVFMQRIVNTVQSRGGSYRVVLGYILGFIGLHIVKRFWKPFIAGTATNSA